MGSNTMIKTTGARWIAALCVGAWPGLSVAGVSSCVGWVQGLPYNSTNNGAAAYDGNALRIIAIRTVANSVFEQFSYDGVAITPQFPETTPRLHLTASPRPAMTTNTISGVPILLGADAIWTYENEDWVEGPASPIAGLANAAMAFDGLRGKAVVFGGAAPLPLSATLEYDGEELVMVAPTVSPPARQRHAMAYDARRGVTVMFGGSNSSTLLGDLWEYDGVTWTEVPSAGLWPAPRIRHAMAFDPRRGVVVMHGGDIDGSGMSREWWEWNGESWRRRMSEEAAGPLSAGHQLVSFDARGELVMVWGVHPYIWSATTPQAPWVSEHPTSQTASIGETATFAVAVGDGAPYHFQWRKNGVSIPGAHGGNLVLTNVQLSDAAVYDCVVGRLDFDSSCVQTIAGPAALTVVTGCAADVDGNGAVNFADLNEVLSRYNSTCP